MRERSMGRLLIFLFAISAPVALAQKEESTATLEETLTFIQSKVASFGEYKSSISPFIETSQSFKSVKGCTVQTEWIYREGGYSKKFVKKFSLSDIDPLTIKLRSIGTDENGGHSIEMEAAAGTSISESKMTYENGTSKSEGPTSVSEVSFGVKNREVANRILTAVKHAVKLCGGKIDPF